MRRTHYIPNTMLAMQHITRIERELQTKRDAKRRRRKTPNKRARIHTHILGHTNIIGPMRATLSTREKEKRKKSTQARAQGDVYRRSIHTTPDRYTAGALHSARTGMYLTCLEAWCRRAGSGSETNEQGT